MNCPKCNLPFNNNNKKPYTICPNKHILCKVCVDTLFKKPLPKCSICSVILNKNKIHLYEVQKIKQEPKKQDDIEQDSIFRLPQVKVIDLEEVQQPRAISKQSKQQKQSKQSKQSTQIMTVAITTVEKNVKNSNIGMTNLQLISQSLLIIIYLWGNFTITSIYLISIPNFFLLAFFNILIYQAYHLIKNHHHFTQALFTKYEMENLILKQVAFFSLQENTQDQVLYYVYFGLKWCAYVFSIVGITYQHHNWNIFAILSIILNLISLIQPILSYYFLRDLLRNLLNKLGENPTIQKIGLGLLILYGFTETIMQYAFIAINCPYYLIFYFLFYITTIIIILVSQSQFLSVNTLIILGVAVGLIPFSLGCFYFLSYLLQKKLPLYIVFVMIILKHFINPILMMTYCLITPYSTFNYTCIIFSIFSSVQLTAGLLIQKNIENRTRN